MNKETHIAPSMEATLSYLEAHLQPGERLVCQLKHSRKWHSLLRNLLANIALAVATFFLFRFLERSLAVSYVAPDHFLGRTQFIVINLFIGVVPILVFLALVQDFVYTFFTELVLTDRRIFGRVNGLLRLKELDIPLDEMESITAIGNYLSLVFGNGQHLLVSGLLGAKGFVKSYRSQRMGIEVTPDWFAEELPDAFTFEKVH